MAQLTIFAKRAQSNDGRTFYKYLTTLTRKDGAEEKVEVKFTEDAGNPKPENCPCNIIVDRADCNMVARDYVDPKTGECKIAKRIWVSAYTNGPEYVDHSMDDYDF